MSFIQLAPHHITHVLGSWEFFISLGFEWDFITGRKRFRWPLVSRRPSLSSSVLMGGPPGVLFRRTLLSFSGLDWNVRLTDSILHARHLTNISAIALDTTHEINCQALYTFNQVSLSRTITDFPPVGSHASRHAVADRKRRCRSGQRQPLHPDVSVPIRS